jgi:hypothetical protein
MHRRLKTTIGMRPASRMFSVGNAWLQRRHYKTVREAPAGRAITLDDLAAVLKKYPLSENTTVAVGPLADVAEPSERLRLRRHQRRQEPSIS